MFLVRQQVNASSRIPVVRATGIELSAGNSILHNRRIFRFAQSNRMLAGWPVVYKWPVRTARALRLSANEERFDEHG